MTAAAGAAGVPPDLVLHVGMAKAGSTSIQAFLEANRDRLARRGTLYPEGLGRPERPQSALWVRHAIATGDWCGLPAHARAHAERTFAALFPDPEAFDARLDAVARPGAARRVVLSCEELWQVGAADGPTAAALARDLRRRFARITVVAVLRRPDLHLASLHAEGMKAGHPLDVDAALAAPPAAHLFADALGRWRARLAPDRLAVIPFEPAQMPGGDVVPAFRAEAGLDDADLATPAVRRNPSLDAVGVAAMARLVAADRGDPDRWGKFAAIRDVVLATPGGGPPWRLGDAEARAYLRRLAPQMAAAARDALGRADGVLFRDPAPEGRAPRSAPDDASVAARLAEVALALQDRLWRSP